MAWLIQYDPSDIRRGETRISALERQLRIPKDRLRLLVSAKTPDSLSIVTYMERAGAVPGSRFADDASGESVVSRLGLGLSRRQSILETETPATTNSEAGPDLTAARVAQLETSPPPLRYISEIELLEVKNYDASRPNRHYQDMVTKHGRFVHLDLTVPPMHPGGDFDAIEYKRYLDALDMFKEIVHFIGYRKQLLHHCAVTNTKSIWYLPCNKGKMTPSPNLKTSPSTQSMWYLPCSKGKFLSLIHI